MHFFRRNENPEAGDDKGEMTNWLNGSQIVRFFLASISSSELKIQIRMLLLLGPTVIAICYI